MAEGQPIVFTATVTDSELQTSAPVTATVNVLTDNVAPTVTINTPKAETSYTFVAGGANTFPIAVKALDGESGVAAVHLEYDGHAGTDLTYNASTQAWTGTGTITRKTADTRIHVTVTAVDYHGNATPATFSGVPTASTVPPSSPPSGPRSMIQSETLITSRLCSITTTLLP